MFKPRKHIYIDSVSYCEDKESYYLIALVDLSSGHFYQKCCLEFGKEYQPVRIDLILLSGRTGRPLSFQDGGKLLSKATYYNMDEYIHG